MMQQRASRSVWLGQLDVTETIDRSSLRWFAISVLILCGLGMIMDGYDIQVITFAAPLLIKEYGIARSMLGPVFSSGLVGTTLGALTFGPLGDRIGRKLCFSACIAGFSLCSLGTIAATGVPTLMAWRFAGGLALGGLTPIAVAYAAEYCPARWRVMATMLIAIGFPVGAGGGGFIAAKMLPVYGWQSVFWLGGIAPLILLVFIIAFLPPSLNDLARRGQSQDLARVLVKLAPNAPVNPSAAARLGDTELGFPVGRLFTEGRALRTVVLWIMFFANILALYFMLSWLPTLAAASGFTLANAVRAAAVAQVGSIIGTLTLAALVRKFNVFKIIGTGFLLGAISLALLAISSGSVLGFTAVAFFAGFFVVGTQTGANAVSAFAYPPSLQSTGVGWALGIGRVGAIIGPSLGGLLLSLGWPTRDLFFATTFPALIAAICAFVLSAELRLAEADDLQSPQDLMN